MTIVEWDMGQDFMLNLMLLGNLSLKQEKIVNSIFLNSNISQGIINYYGTRNCC